MGRLDEGEASGEGYVDAGGFSAWLDEMSAALQGEHDMDVPCGACTGCCTSSQFVSIGPDETDTLAHIPVALLFPAPRLPRGHVLLGYDERGHCPMLVDGACSIYEHRPRTCRTYDCRVFVAAGVPVDDPAKADIDRRVQRWQFTHPTETDRVEHDAVRAAAVFLRERRGPPEARATSATVTSTQIAVAAVAVHDLFLGRDDETGQLVAAVPEPEAVRAALSRGGDPSAT
jgi:uncharacterized protein